MIIERLNIFYDLNVQIRSEILCQDSYIDTLHEVKTTFFYRIYFNAMILWMN